jgi:hypothetical protein
MGLVKGCSEQYKKESIRSYVTTGEVTTLEHELRDDTVERRALVAKALLTSAEASEVLGSLGDNIVEEVESDPSTLLCSTRSIN